MTNPRLVAPPASASARSGISSSALDTASLDAARREAADAIAVGIGNVTVVGEPGSGKTTVVIEAVRAAVEAGARPERVVVLAPTRGAAARLRDQVSAVMARPTGVPVVRTAASLAFGVLSALAEGNGVPAPVLVTGAEQDTMLRELLEGHLSGRVGPLNFGEAIPMEALRLPGFRAELRDLLMRASEAGLSPGDLDALGRKVGRPEWVAAAAVLAEYLDVTTLRSTPADQGPRYDPATVVAEAAHVLRRWPLGAGRPPSWDLVIVDDAQDATAATVDLIGALAEGGARVALVGNADEAVQGYRGAVPSALAASTAAAGPGAFDARLIELGQGKRQSGPLTDVARALAARIGTMGVGSPRSAGTGAADQEATRASASPVNPMPVVTLTAAHRYGQSRAIAAQLRIARHGLAGPEVPWSRMVVIARSAAALRDLRSDLAATDIPCETLGEAVALHSQPAVAPLLRILRAAASKGEPWTEEEVAELLTSRAVGLDPVGLRRLRRELVREERAAGGERPSGSLLVEAIADPTRWASLRGHEARAAARASRAVVAAARLMDRAKGARSASPGEVLWAAWEALGVADAWRTAALAGSARDDADLDAVIAVMRAAQNYAERLPEASALQFVEYLEAQDFAADSLGARAWTGDVVAFATPAAAAGREWDVVVIAGLEEGVWPNLRLRDSALGAQYLADIVAGRAAAKELDAEARVALAQATRRHVLDDETRAILVAATRARTRLVATAVVGEDSRASRFLSLIADAAGVEVGDSSSDSGPGADGGGERVFADLRGAVASLRLRAAAASGAERARLATLLALATRAGLAGADPREWHGAVPFSIEDGFWDADQPVRVSPSKVESIERCALKWALESVGGTREATQAQEVGLLIHKLAERYPEGPAPALLADFDAQWSALYATDTWRQRDAYRRAREKVQRLANYLEAHAGADLLTEHSFAVEVGRARLTGSADRIEITDSGATVADIKTGNAIPSVAEAADNAQLAMYQLAIAHGAVAATSMPAGAELVFLSAGKGWTSRRQGPIDVDSAERRLGAVVETMAGDSYLAVVNDLCDGCPVRRSCPVHAEGNQVTS